MASGSFKVSTSNEYIDGIVKWSSSADVVKNQSTVTATLYLSRTNTGYTTYGSGTFSLTIDGNKGSDTKSYSLTYNSDTVMAKHTFVVDHNDDGKKSIKITASGSGSTFSVTSTSDTVTLDTIQRKSTLSTSANWTAGTNFTLSVSRTNSSFRHEAEVYVKRRDGVWDWIKQVSFSTSETSKSSSFTSSEVNEIYDHLDGRSSCESRIVLQTFNGSTMIGSNEYTGTVTKANNSTLTTSVSYKAGENFTLSLSRVSGFFNHKAYIDVKDSGGTWRNIKAVDFTTSQTSLSSSFSTTDYTNIFKYLNGRTSMESRVNFHTYCGSSDLGYNTYSGTVTVTNSSTGKITNPTGISSTSGQGDDTVWIDQDISISITRANSGFTHILKFKDGNTGSVIHTSPIVGTSYIWKPTVTEKNAMYAKTPNSNEFDGQLDIYTYYGSELVGSATNMDINYRVRNSNPTFTSANISYVDTNPKTLDITGTGNSTYIIQNQSTPKVTITAATGINSATLSNYIANINGSEKSRTTAGTLDMTVVNADKNVDLSVKAIDSRGNFTTATKTVTMIPYKNPTANISLKRKNNFENETTLKITGAISLLTINGVNKNQLSKIEYRYKATTSSTWSEWKDDASYNTVASSYTATKILDLDNQYAYQVEVKVTDVLVTVSNSGSVPVGIPIFFIDAINNAVGVNALPLAGEAARIKGKTVLDGEFSITNTSLQWIDIVPTSGWVNYGGSDPTAGYIKIGGTVYLKGIIKNGVVTSGTVLLVLPSGYRPSVRTFASTLCSGNGIVRVVIETDGSVTLNSAPASNAWVQLDNISFIANGG